MEKQIIKRQPATLLPTRSKAVHVQRSSKIGRYHNEVTMEVARTFPDKHLTPNDLSKVHYGNSSKSNCDYIRSVLWKAYTELQNNGELWYPVYSATGHHELIAIKQFRNDETDAKAFPFYLDKALKRKEITQEHYEKLQRLADAVKGTNENDGTKASQ